MPVTTTIEARKDLYHSGERVFTKGKTYQIERDYTKITEQHQLIDAVTTNDLGEPHIIGGQWYKHFEIEE